MRARVPYLDRIWRVKSSIELDRGLGAGEVFARLRPLLDTQGSQYAIDGNSLAYSKTNPAAQDKLATFTAGTLVVEGDAARTRIFYDVTSTALFLCFLAPLAFLAFGQFSAFLNEVERPAFLAEKQEKEAEKKAKEGEVAQLHWIDQMLGATAPDAPDEKDSKARNERDSEEDEEGGYHSPKTAYAFAGIFFLIYLVGRVLEPYLLKRTFRAALSGPLDADETKLNERMEAGSHPAPKLEGNPKS